MKLGSDYNRIGIFSGTFLKIAACIFMVIDHVGLTFFPSEDIFRILGRLSFPIFAFLIAEGNRYSRHKLRRFLIIFAIGLGFLVFYYFYGGQFYGNIFLTFSISIFLNFLFDFAKKLVLESFKPYKLIFAILIISSSLCVLYILYDSFHFEYKFSGMILPVLINLFDFKNIKAHEKIKKLDCHLVRMVCLLIGLIYLSFDGNLGAIQFYCLLSFPLIFLYNGKSGTKKFKYAFYIFYPLHIIVIEGAAILIKMIQK